MTDLTHNHILFLTLDSLRYDVAEQEFQKGNTPNLWLHNPEGWTHCHSPGSFTYAAHHAFFAGFLPTPAANPKAPRLFAARFAGSETTGSDTLVFDTPDIVTGFTHLGFRTICIGGVGFFNQQTPLGRVLPSLFSESYWEPIFGVTEPGSTRHQFEHAANLLADSRDEKVFLFINVSAIHQPNYFYSSQPQTLSQPAIPGPPPGIPGSPPGTPKPPDTLDSHAAALRYVDSQLPILFTALQATNRDTFCIVCSDHGTAYGENNYQGHRIGHPSVWDVPMTTFLLKRTENTK